MVIKPNNDPGFNKITRAYEQFSNLRFKIIPSMRFEHFSRLLENSAIVIGNSSLGVREAPFFGVPSIDIGTRQTNRSISNSVFNLKYRDLAQLGELTRSLWGREYSSSTEFGDGGASMRIADIISSGVLKNLSVQKFFAELAYD